MFRNRAIWYFSLAYSAVSLIVCLAAYLKFGTGALRMFGFFALASLLAFLTFTVARYRKIAGFCEAIDSALHNEEQLTFEEAKEGELAILSSEITKMTVRIREQNDALKKDRQYRVDFLADVAHQIKTPLTTANLILTLLDRQSGLAEQTPLLYEMQGLVDRMDALITTLLDLARLDTGVVAFKSEVLHLGDIVAQALAPLAIPMDIRGVSLSLSCPDDLLVQGDPVWLAEALTNVIKNCMENAGDSAAISIAASGNALFTILTVSDNGPGFSPEAKAHLFERFWRSPTSSGSGYGIGLTLAKAIVSHHNGTIEADDNPSGGARFTLRFARVTDRSLHSHQKVT